MFADREHPLRASALPNLMRCPHRHMLMELKVIENQGSTAADTGSAVHAAVDAWHKGAGYSGAIEEMRAKYQTHFPKADLHDAELTFKPYTEDPRNAPGEVQQTEVKIEVMLPAHPHDPTGEPIYILGKADQLRESGYWDMKVSEKPGFELIHDYAFQLASYAAGLRVPVGGIINPKGYRRQIRETKKLPDPKSQPTGIFFHTCWRDEHVEHLMLELRIEVARIRAGTVSIRPGGHCSYCPAGSYFNCLEM